jgi:hypothetical protein
MEKDEQDDVIALSEAQIVWERLGGHPAEGPLFQRAALEEIQRHELRYNNGDTFALMDAIYQCSCHGLKMPEWVAAGFRHGYQTILECNAKSLGQVFGDPFKKGKHLHALRKRRRLRSVVWNKVREIRNSEPGTAINRELFKRVGREVRPPVSRSEVEEMYYEAARFWGNLLPRKS